MAQQVAYELTLKDLLTPKINDADKAVNRFETSMGRAQNSANSLGNALGIAFSAAAVVGFGKSMLDAGATVENATIGLTTLLQDSAEANQVIATTMKDAMATPFDFKSLLAANKAIISAGVDSKSAREDVLNLANAIAATGGGNDELNRMVVNLQQIKNSGRATGADIKQFAYAGINIYKVLSDATNQPIEKIREMGVSYDMLTLALKKAHDEGGIYYNGLENMQKSFSVQVSNLGDNLFKLSDKMFDDLRPAINSITTGLQSLTLSLMDSWNWLVKNKDVVLPIVAVISGAATAYLALATGIKVATLAQLAFNAVMTANPIGLVVMAIGSLVAGLIYAYNHVEAFRAKLWGFGFALVEFGKIIVGVFGGVGKSIAGALTFNPQMIVSGLNDTISAVRNAGERLGKAANEGYTRGLADFKAGNITTNAPVNLTGGKKGGKETVTPPPAQTKGAQGQKAVTINIKIEDLVKTLNINTTNIKEGTGKLREMIAETLMAATNDAQLVGGI